MTIWIPITYTILKPDEGFEQPTVLVSYTQLTQDKKGLSKWFIHHKAGKFEFYGTKEQLQETLRQMGYDIQDKQGR